MSFEPRVPIPQKGASLMVAFRAHSKNMLVIGDNAVAASRVLSCLEADAHVYIIANCTQLCPELEYRLDHHQITWLSTYLEPSTLDRIQFDMAFITNSTVTTEQLDKFRRRRIPINVADHPELSDFFMTSTYRDKALQVAISTNGQASKLATRIRRELTAQLPPHLGDAIERVGVLRKKVRQLDPSRNSSVRRMTWLAQISEYWSMERLAKLTDRDMDELLDVYHHDEGYESTETPPSPPLVRRHSTKTTGTISLVGAGTGDPDLLTVAALKAINKADLVLADKIVPAPILALIPPTTPLKIARKFPGNADAAQHEFNEIALKAVQDGQHVVRLKQGDPFLFGRGGEEVLFFRKHQIVPRIVPGISSTVAASLAVGIPLTHRTVASQFLVTTGTGAASSRAPLPRFDRWRTDVFLMSVHRLRALTTDLMTTQAYPEDVPCAVVERASCKDQRVVWAPLKRIADLMDAVGSQPPGLLVVGHAVNVLKAENKASEGVAAHLMTDSGLPPFTTSTLDNGSTVFDVSKLNQNLLALHDPEQVF
ncbi:MAG: tetrapyrrole methylase [Benjaminiella poitrasii]|nr:MAG: tetrapyrrole methylase [Benjaminiella poitrasii]